MRTAAVAVCGLFFVACIPTRDNDADPANAPVAAARFIDTNPAGCPALADSSQWFSISAVSRGHCLMIDATETTDPQGVATLDPSHFSYAVISTGGGMLAAPIPLGGGSLRVPLDTALLRTLPPDVALTVRITAADENGHSGKTDIPLVLFNGRPSAVADAITFRRIAVSTTDPIAFGGSDSLDPDGDPLQHCWLFPGDSTEQCVTPVPGQPDFVKPVPADYGEYSARLRVFDGGPGIRGVYSHPDWQVVTHRPRPGWAQAFGAAVAASSIPNTLFRPLGPSQFASPFMFIDRGASSRLIIANGGLQVYSWPQDQSLSSDPGLPNASRFAWDAAASRLWVASDAGTVASWILDGTDTLQPEVAPLALGDNAPPFLFVDGSGDLWLAGLYASTVHEVSPAGAEIAHENLPGSLCALTRRPAGSVAGEAEEVWAVVTSAGVGTILRRAGGSWTPVVSSPQIDSASTFAFFDRDDAWLSTAERGIEHVDVSALDGGLDAASIFAAPTGGISFPQNFVIEPASRELIACDGKRWVRVTLQAIRSGGPGFYCSSPVFDPLGTLYFQSAVEAGGVQTQARGGSTPASALHFEIEVGLPFAGGLNTPPAIFDPETGGIRVVTRRPSIAAVAPDGRFRETTRIRLDGTDVPMPDVKDFRLSADRSTAWITTTSPPTYYYAQQLLALDLTADPPIATTVLPDLQSTVLRSGVFEPMPDGQSILVAFQGTAGIVELDRSGVRTPFFTPPEGEQQLSVSVAADGGVCTSVDVSLTKQIRFHAPNGGAVTDFAPISEPPQDTFSTIAAVTDAGADYCWSMTANHQDIGGGYSDVRAYTSAGTLIHQYTSSGGSLSLGELAPRGRDELWTTDVNVFDFSKHLTHLHFTGMSADVYDTFPDQVEALVR